MPPSLPLSNRARDSIADFSPVVNRFFKNFPFSFSPPGAGPEGKFLIPKVGGHKAVELILPFPPCTHTVSIQVCELDLIAILEPQIVIISGIGAVRAASGSIIFAIVFRFFQILEGVPASLDTQNVSSYAGGGGLGPAEAGEQHRPEKERQRGNKKKRPPFQLR